MPKQLHEMLVELFRGRPTLVADVLSGPLRLPVPEFQSARMAAGDLTDVASTEYRADAVVTLDGRDGPLRAVVVEVQLQIDKQKRRSWAAYVATLYARLGCPVVLLVVCPTQGVASWCAHAILVGEPDFVLRPMVLGPDRLPALTDVEAVRRNPELAVLTAIAQGDQPDAIPTLKVVFAGLGEVKDDLATLYADFVFSQLPAAARKSLEELMTSTEHRYVSEFARRYYDQGQAEGKAEGQAAGEIRILLAILADRGVEVPDEVRTRIAACTDADQLETWALRALSATKIQDLGDEFAA